MLPLEAKALVAAIDLVGNHLPQARLDSARDKIVDALGHDPAREGLAIAIEGGAMTARIVNEGIARRRVLEITYYKENEDSFSERRVEAYRLENGREGWYAECFDLDRQGDRHFKLDRIKEVTISDESFEPRPEAIEMAGVEGWMSDGEVPAASIARVLGITGTLTLAARGAKRGRRAQRRIGGRRVALRGHVLAGPRDPARSR